MDDNFDGTDQREVSIQYVESAVCCCKSGISFHTPPLCSLLSLCCEELPEMISGRLIPDPGSQSPNLGSFQEPKKRKNSKLKTKNSHFTVVIVPSLKFEDLFQICSLFQFPSASGTRWYTFMEQYSVSPKLLYNVSKLINPVARLSRETLSRRKVTEYNTFQYSQS